MPGPRVEGQQALMGLWESCGPHMCGPYRVPLFLQGFLFIVYMIYL